MSLVNHCRCPTIFLVREMLHLAYWAACKVFRVLKGEMRHELVGCSPVPMSFTRLKENTVPSANYLDGTAFALTVAHTLGDPDRLTFCMSVPPCAGPRREMNVGCRKRIALGRPGEEIDVDIAREQLGWTLPRRHGVSSDFHEFYFPLVTWEKLADGFPRSS